VGSAPTPAEAEAKYDAAWRAALDAAIDAGGTLSHHHGVGRSKAPKLGRELGAGVDVLHALRNTLDPAGILNPGNLVPRERAERRPVARPPSSPIVDSASRLVHAAGKATLAEVQTALSKNGLALDLGPEAPSLDTTVDAWIARGAPGAPDPWTDPVAHLVAGFSARLRSGTDVEVRRAPRRAVGPDLLALFHGMEGRVGTIESAHLTAHDPRQPKARAQSTKIARNPAISAEESALVDRVVEAAQSVR
jgi:alkyldihydroxyacetonephosphate synthase